MSHHIVEFKDLCFSYPDGTDALRGVNFRITHGESVGVVGANGAGKSTLLLHMNGCLLPTSGTVTNRRSLPYRQDETGDPEEGGGRVSEPR